MAKRDIIVIGASAGGIASVLKLVEQLPADLGAAIFVTVHMPAWHKSELPRVISRKSALPAIFPISGQPIEKGVIYVAPPDQHLLIDSGHVHLWRGPKENRHRPAINVLFRSAAVHCRDRTIGVIRPACWTTVQPGCGG